jgi:hypothetical protein
MRGDEQLQSGLVLMTTLEEVVPDEHPLRAVRALVDRALSEMKPALDALYASRGRPSIAPEYLFARPACAAPLRRALRAAPLRGAALQPFCCAGS